MYIFNNVLIIGLGLVGSSLARVMKANNIAKSICGYDQLVTTIQTGFSLQIIDESILTLDNQVEKYDLIILCTPVNSYGEIVKKLKKHISKDAIITDVGSVKESVISTIKKGLGEDLSHLYIPSHPIAGSEKSGIDAGSDDLFNNKKIILTPTEKNKPEAIEKIKTFWKMCGGKIEIMEAKKHDEIYASVSHIIHCICYSYAMYIKKNHAAKFNEIAADIQEDFKTFVRLGGSDIHMWQDILLSNQKAILHSADNLMKNLNSIIKELESKTKKISPRLVAAKTKRNVIDKGNYNFVKKTKLSYSSESYVLLQIIPKIIACVIMESTNKDLVQYAGRGFYSTTETLLKMPANIEDTIQMHKDKTTTYLKNFIKDLKSFFDVIEQGGEEKVHIHLENCLSAYNKLTQAN